MSPFKPSAGKGDFGYTDLFLKRVPKTDLKIKLNALLDEVGAIIGVLRSKSGKNRKVLAGLQKRLVSLSSFIAGYGEKKKIEKETAEIAELIKKHSAGFNLDKFIVFGEDYHSAMLNFVRTKIRICEIIAWQAKDKTAAVYLNRLSDYLFVLSVKK